ncbi:MAG: glycolate oxidase subunit GlcE [Gammaproteobacteria bacterium]|nr:glycolate oxidase subunit GlcE [Gammaproteobacteria bacterium]
MSPDEDLTTILQEAIESRFHTASPVEIRGTGSKAFMGREAAGEVLITAGHRGIISYDPTELVVRARSGTPLAELEETLEAAGQFLPCEPPRFNAGGTVGGAVACGLAGPRRPYAGAVRDFLLGVRMINGAGKVLNFGGQVMKNVAGYDAFRLQAGAWGTLGLLLDVSFKVLPKPEAEQTLGFELTEDQAIDTMNRWAGQPLPLSAAAHHEGLLRVRLSGTTRGVADARRRLGGDEDEDGFWEQLRHHELSFFQAPEPPLWRITLSPATPPLELPGQTLVDWGGGQRWLRTELPGAELRRRLAETGGFAHLLRTRGSRDEVFHPLEPGVARLHEGLKRAFDPAGILNPGRMYEAW